MIPFLRVLCIIALIYNGWIIFRVVNDWAGLIAAIFSVVLFPISNVVMPFVMLFISSPVAGPLSLWPAVIFIGFLSWVAKKKNGSLMLG
jgi:hypothetical protein